MGESICHDFLLLIFPFIPKKKKKRLGTENSLGSVLLDSCVTGHTQAAGRSNCTHSVLLNEETAALHSEQLCNVY